MQKVSSIFDIIGPVMVGPSSSHTAGAVRLGALARAIWGGSVPEATIHLHGSFSATADGHGTTRALVAGLLGMTVDDVRIPDALALAREQGFTYTLTEIELEETHPNTVVFAMSDGVQSRTVQGSSVGGGEVLITHIDGFEVALDGSMPTLMVVHKDRPGTASAITAVLADVGINIATMHVAREKRGQRALTMIETDTPVHDAVRNALEAIKEVASVTFIDVV